MRNVSPIGAPRKKLAIVSLAIDGGESKLHTILIQPESHSNSSDRLKLVTRYFSGSKY